jgi:hypothetical protein
MPVFLCDFKRWLIAKLSMKSLGVVPTHPVQGGIFHLFKDLTDSVSNDTCQHNKSNAKCK